MISLITPPTAWRAWLELMRDSFSRSSFEIRVRCTSALNFSKLSCSTLYHPHEYGLYLYPNKLNRLFLSALAGRPHAILAICLTTREMGESSSASGVAVFCALRAA